MLYTILVTVALMAGLFLSSCKPPAPPGQTSRVTKPSGTISYPNFPIIFYQGQEVLGGREARFSSLLGSRPIVLNFWASNCPPCTREMPEFQKVYESYRGKVLFFGLDVGRFFPAFGDEEFSQQELQRLDITYPAGTLPNIETVRALEISGLPSTVFITPKGEKYSTWVGTLNQKKLTELVENLLSASGPR